MSRCWVDILWHFQIKRHINLLYYFAKSDILIMDQKWIAIPKPASRNQKLSTKPFITSFLLEICKSFHRMPKDLVGRKRFCVGRTSNEFQKKWDRNLKEMEMKCWDLLLEEYCNKLFSLMDSFWVEISSKRVDICWLVRVRGHLDKVETGQQRIKQRKLSTLSLNSSLKKWLLSDLMNIFLTFSLRQTFHHIAALNVQNLKISILSQH